MPCRSLSFVLEPFVNLSFAAPCSFVLPFIRENEGRKRGNKSGERTARQRVGSVLDVGQGYLSEFIRKVAKSGEDWCSGEDEGMYFCSRNKNKYLQIWQNLNQVV